eukprot:6162317-Prorocentrum_lima.AAC.1
MKPLQAGRGHGHPLEARNAGPDDAPLPPPPPPPPVQVPDGERNARGDGRVQERTGARSCLLYTSDAADDM